jgi:hypothetical protein
MEAGGMVAQSVQSVQEGLRGFSPAFSMHYEANSSLASSVVVSVYERLLTVRAVF